MSDAIINAVEAIGSRYVKEFVVFYAWQSDTLQRHNRFLIRMALEAAAERISSDATISTRVRIDVDTEGVLGQPPVTDTILNKIQVCDVFAPDFTFVATTEGGKLMPNPNVMLEYGYALRAKGHHIMMPVMNTAHGPPEKLPFDMGHLRHPRTYHLDRTATQAERRAVRKKLSNEFENVLRLMIAAAKPKNEKPFAETKAVVSPAFFFRRGDVLAEFGTYENERQEYRFDSDKAIFLRLFPAAAQAAVTRAKVKAVFGNRKPRPMALNVIGGPVADNSYGSIIIDPLSNSTIQGMTEGFPTGELWGLNSQLFRMDQRTVFREETKWTTYISMIGVEKLFVQTLENYIWIAIEEYQLRPPFVIEAGGTGLTGVFAHVPSVEISQGELVGPFRSPSFEKRYVMEDVQPRRISDALRQFFDEFYDFAACSRSAVLTDAHVTANGLPPRT